jgi:uncharacterized protein
MVEPMTGPEQTGWLSNPVIDRAEILRTVVGSGVHGIAIEGTDDHDEMGVFVEPPEHVIGLSGALDHHVWRTKAEGVRSGPGDVDLVRYSLRKYMRLAVKGNPTILLPLYAPDKDVIRAGRLGKELRALAPKIVSLQAGHRFLGYMQSQLERMEGLGKQNRLPKRPEIVEAHGYDTKYASHALRLAMQGVELLVEGKLNLPMRDPLRDRVLAVKRGELSKVEVLEEIRFFESELQRLLGLAESPLPMMPDLGAINDWLIRAHARHWRDLLGWRNAMAETAWTAADTGVR